MRYFLAQLMLKCLTVSDWVSQTGREVPGFTALSSASEALRAPQSKKTAMNAVTLKKDGSINLNGKTVATDALELLSFQIELEDAYNLRSFFKMMDRYSLLARLNAFFPSYIEQYHQCSSQGCDAGVLDYLEFGKTVEMIGVPDKRLEIYNALFGVCGGQTAEIKSMPVCWMCR